MKIVKEIHIEEAEYNALIAIQRLFIELHQEGVYNPDECINIIDGIEDFLSSEDVRIPHLLERGSNEEFISDCVDGFCGDCTNSKCKLNPDYDSNYSYEQKKHCPYGLDYNGNVPCDLCPDTGCGYHPNYEG